MKFRNLLKFVVCLMSFVIVLSSCNIVQVFATIANSDSVISLDGEYSESRVIVEKGIFFNKKNSMPFNTIQDISRSQSIIGRILSVGSIELYSAYDGKNLKIEDISSPKKVEDLIFENLRGTHLRTPVDFDSGYSDGFTPASPSEPGHYRRMEDLDDLTLVNAKEQKKQKTAKLMNS